MRSYLTEREAVTCAKLNHANLTVQTEISMNANLTKKTTTIQHPWSLLSLNDQIINQDFNSYLTDDVCRNLEEYVTIAHLVEQSQGLFTPQIFDVIEYQDLKLPLIGMSFGATDINAPAITFVGGIHGVERIGCQVILSYLHTLIHRAQWDSSLQALFSQVRFNFLPVMNPVGVYRGTRANGQGVDLMRNAPIDAQASVPWLVGGQHLSRYLPWYRGQKGQLERENQVLIAFLKQQCLHRPFNLVLDCHSGFGLRDRLWIPYAYRKRPARKIANYFALQQLFQQTYPHNKYIFEPQSLNYTTHGDLWDHVGKIVKHEYQQPFLSLTLEMGSWNWVKKRPSQLLSFSGLFNPQAQHRWTRVQRSHLVLFEFLKQAVANYQYWLPTNDNKAALRKAAIDHWYR